MRGIGRLKVLAAVGAVALVISACGSSKSTSTPTTVSPTTAGSGGSTAPTTASPVSGTPYKLMWTYTTSDGAETGGNVSAIEKGVDARGGIAGHPLQIVLCGDNNVASQATVCARQAVADPNMLGVIADASTCSSQLLPLLTQAQMASINADFFCPEDFKSPAVFPFNGGTFDDVGASAIGVKYFNDPNVVATTVDLPAGREYPPLVQEVVGPVGGKVVGAVYVPYTAADLAPFAAQIASYKGVLAEGNPTEIGIRLGKALQSIGYNQPVIYNSTVFDPAIIKTNFGNPTNAYLYVYYDESSPGWQMFLSDMSTYAPGSTYQASDLVDAWLAANVVAQIAKTLPTVSAKAIFSYLSTATDLTTFGMTPPLNFTVPQKALGGLIPRAVNPDVALYHYVNGAVVRVTPFEDFLP